MRVERSISSSDLDHDTDTDAELGSAPHQRASIHFHDQPLRDVLPSLEPAARPGDDVLLSVTAFNRGNRPAPPHDVQFYRDDAYLIDGVVQFIRAGLESGDPVIVVASRAHLAAIDERAARAGIDAAGARESGHYQSFDAAEVLPTIMVGDEPDPERFASVIGSLIAGACAHGQPVRVFGELVELLALSGNHHGALRLEQMWNDLQARYPFALLCGYSMESVARDETREFLAHVCAEHHHVTPLESYTSLGTDADRSREIVELQQKAIILEAEIAARKAAELKLQEALLAEQLARAEAEAALRQRDEFLALAAHDLRTPATVLSGHAQLLQRKLRRKNATDDARMSETLDAIADHSQNLSRLIDEILDTSRLDSGAFCLDRVQVDLSRLAADVVATFRRGHARPRIQLIASEPVTVQVDDVRIRQVLANLLDNAVKHSPGSGTIEVAVQRTSGETVELSVRDYGSGVPEASRDSMFERYHQAHPATGRAGLGLGLYISRQIVALHGGSLWAEFPDDGGSRFVASLPASHTS